MTIILQIPPGSALIIGVIFVLLLVWFFWPNKGGMALITKLSQNNKRVLLEDALKFIFDCEYHKKDCTIERVAEHLNISDEKAEKLIDRLTEMELISLDGNSILLTDTGRSYSLRIVRIHRIWERYLADQTNVAPTDWHDEACRVEHTLTEDQAEKLAARIGNPVFDPHGDPIPSPDGKLPSPKGVPLNELEEGQTGRIIHLEDEPQSIYEQLVILGLYPGMPLYVTDVKANKITFIAEEEEHVLTPLFAANITVEKTSDDVVQMPKSELLSSLKIGEDALITGISPNCRGQQRRRLMDLGIVPGSHVSAVIRSASGNPTGYRVMGTTIGIRKEHANYIFIERKEQGT